MRSRLLLLVVVVLSLLVGCGQEVALAPPPEATVDVTKINLVPFHDKESGLDGGVPEGWFPALPGFYLAGPPEDKPDTVLIQRLEPGVSLDQVLATWKGLLGLTEDPKPAGHRRTQAFAWDLYTYEKEDATEVEEGSIALAETRAGVVVVLLVTAPGSHSTLYETVFIPAVDAVTLGADDATEQNRPSEWPVVAVIEQAGNDARESVEFSLAVCTRLYLYALGEGTVQGMEDFGSVENASSGQIVWQMHFFETEAAGAYKNRRASRSLTLPAGNFRLN
jgi:hypothetical protein